jgi:hypothetical protein
VTQTRRKYIYTTTHLTANIVFFLFSPLSITVLPTAPPHKPSRPLGETYGKSFFTFGFAEFELFPTTYTFLVKDPI